MFADGEARDTIPLPALVLATKRAQYALGRVSQAEEGQDIADADREQLLRELRRARLAMQVLKCTAAKQPTCQDTESQLAAWLDEASVNAVASRHYEAEKRLVVCRAPNDHYKHNYF